jgi:hypothetical protein
VRQEGGKSWEGEEVAAAPEAEAEAEEEEEAEEEGLRVSWGTVMALAINSRTTTHSSVTWVSRASMWARWRTRWSWAERRLRMSRRCFFCSARGSLENCSLVRLEPGRMALGLSEGRWEASIVSSSS